MGMFDDLIEEQTKAKKKDKGLFDDLVAQHATGTDPAPRQSEPPEVTRSREAFRAQGPVKIAMGNLMGLPDEINSAGAAAIDRVVGRTDDWNERRKLYRGAYKDERAKAENQLGWGGTLAADLVGGAAASPFRAAGAIGDKMAPMVPTLPFPMLGAMKPALPAAQGVTQAVVNPIIETGRNLPALMKTGAAYGAAGGFIGSPEDDFGSRAKTSAYGAVGGAAFMPGLHLGLTAAGSAAPGIAGTARRGFETLTGTSPAQRAQMLANKQGLLESGLKSEEIYGPFLRPDGGSWLSRSIANSPAGHNTITKAADRHLGALERNLSNELDATGASRNRFVAAQDRQKFMDRQVNQYSMSPEQIQFASDEMLRDLARPLTGHLPDRPMPGNTSGPGGPGPQGGPGGQPGPGSGGGGMPPSSGGPKPRGPDIAQAYANARQMRYEGKLPPPDAYWTKEEASALKDMWKYTNEKINHPDRLTNWIIRNGGIKDIDGDIASMIGKANMRPGLINNKSGMHPDDMTRHAWESGFLESLERPTPNELFSYLHDDLRGQPVVRIVDREILDDILAQNQFRDELGRHGLTARREADFDRALMQPIPKESRPTREPPKAPEVSPVAETAPTFLNPPVRPANDARLRDTVESIDAINGRSPQYAPSAENAPQFMKRRMQVAQPSEGRDLAVPGRELRAPGRGVRDGMNGEALPPEPPAPARRLPEPDEVPPPDFSRTDKDRIAAMYEQQNRMIPGQARGGMGNFRDSHAHDAQITRIVEDIRRNARAEGRLPGDKPKMGFWESPASDLIRREVQRHLPNDLVTSLFERVRVAPRQMMRYRTAVRDADTSDPMMRTTTQTWLPRAENALTVDIEARLARLEDGGVALQHWQNSNRQYAAWKEQHVRPLKSVIGENVKPEQAFDKLAMAMKGKDLSMVRSYADAHQRGGQQLEGAGALVSHLMEGGIGNFVKEFSTYRPEAKAALFRGVARPLGQALDRYVALAAPAVRARQQMTWKQFNLHTGGIGTAVMLNSITTSVTLALGQYGAAKFLSSPAYVNWLTRAAPRVANGGPHAWAHQIKLLAAIAEADDTQRGKDVVSALSRLLTYKPEKLAP